MAFFKVVSGARFLDEFPLTDQPQMIGRISNCEIALDDNKISRNHASALYRGERCLVRDNNSNNGSYVNGFRLPAHETWQMFPGDDLHVGNTVVRLFETDFRLPADAIEGLEIIDVIDETLIAVCFRARQKAMDREVEVVVLRPEYSKNKRSLGLFAQAAREASKMNHPYILPIHNIGQTKDGLCYYTCELFHGPRLSFRIGLKGKLEPILTISERVADALEFAHSRGLLHRHLTASSIWVDDSLNVRVVGLGLPHRFETTPPDKALPFYDSPEALVGKPLDGRSDLYSFGALLFHCFAGHPPFMGDDADQVRHKVVNAIAPPLAQEEPELPENVAAIVDKLLEKDPQARFQTAGELRDALRVAMGVTESAPAAEAEEEAPRSPGTRKRRRQRTAAAEDTGGDTEKQAAVRVRTTRPNRRRDTQPKEESPTTTYILVGLGSLVLLGILAIALLSIFHRPETTVNGNTTPSIEKIIAVAENYEKEGDLIKALELYEKVLKNYPDNPEILETCRQRVRLLSDALDKRAKEKEYDAAFAEYEQLQKEKPKAFTELLATLDRLEEAYPKFAKRAEDERADIQTTMQAEVDKLKSRTKEMMLEGDFDRAFSAIKRFRSEYLDFPLVKQTDQIETLVQQELKERVEAFKERLQSKVQKKLYAEALKECETIRNSMRSQTVLEQISATERDINQKLANLFHPIKQEVIIKLGKRQFLEVRRLFNHKKFGFLGTRYEARFAELESLLEGTETLHDFVVDSMQRKDRRTIPEKLELPKTDKLKGELYISSGDTDGFRVSDGMRSVAIDWNDLTRPQILEIYKLYAPTGNQAFQETLVGLEKIYR